MEVLSQFPDAAAVPLSVSPHLPPLSGFFMPLRMKSCNLEAHRGVTSSGAMDSLMLYCMCTVHVARLECLKFSPFLPASRPLQNLFPLPEMLFLLLITRPSAPLLQLKCHFFMEPFPEPDQDRFPLQTLRAAANKTLERMFYSSQHFSGHLFIYYLFIYICCSTY